MSRKNKSHSETAGNVAVSNTPSPAPQGSPNVNARPQWQVVYVIVMIAGGLLVLLAKIVGLF
jgi:hypothetical protein